MRFALCPLSEDNFMLTNYLKVAVRNFLRHKMYSFINIFGLAVGIACCLLILLFIQDEISYDSFHKNADRIYRVNTDLKFGGTRIAYSGYFRYDGSVDETRLSGS